MAEQQRFAELDTIQQAQNGCSAAYGTLYDQHMGAIYRYIYKRVGESAEAEDLTQTVFIKAWQALRDYKPTGAPFRAWLYRIAHNAVVDYYRTQRDPLLWDDLVWMTDPHSTPEKRLLDTERQETVQNAIAELRPTYQAVIVRRFLNNMDYVETAAELGSQVNNVRVLQHRALDALRRVLAQDSALWLAAVVTTITLLLGGNIVRAAERALPGDRLYLMRTMVEKASLMLADDATDIRLHAYFATQQVNALQALYQQGRVDDMSVTVAQLSAHVRVASAKVATITQADQADHHTLTAQFAQVLDSQSTALNELAVAAPAPLQAALQPAIDAIIDAQTNLPEQASEPSTIIPTATPTATVIPTATAPIQVTPETHQAPTPLATHTAAPIPSSTISSDSPVGQRDDDRVTTDPQATGFPILSPTRAPAEKENNRPPVQADSQSAEHQPSTQPSNESGEEHPISTSTNLPDTEKQQATATHLDLSVAHPAERQTGDKPANELPSDAERTSKPDVYEPDNLDNNQDQPPQPEQTEEQRPQATQDDGQRSQQSRPEAENPAHENERHR